MLFQQMGAIQNAGWLAGRSVGTQCHHVISFQVSSNQQELLFVREQAAFCHTVFVQCSPGNTRRLSHYIVIFM